MTNYDVEHTIKKEMSGDVRDAFVAIGNRRDPGKGLEGKAKGWGYWERGRIPWLSHRGSFLSYQYWKISTAAY